MQQLGDVAVLARLLVDAERNEIAAEQALAAAKETARRIREESLPSVMQELGLTELTLDDGSEIKTGMEVYCGIKVDDREAAFGWLEENGFGGLIKTEVVVPFGRSDEERKMLTKLKRSLEKAEYQYTAGQSIHAGTLKAWLKEQLREGDPKKVPLQLFGARPVTVAKVKLAKGE